MVPEYLKPNKPTRLKPCAERMVETCDVVSADSCCGVIPCKLCLEWDEYGQATQFGSANFATSSWTGTVGGHAFVSYWQRNYATDECEYIVTLEGEEVYRATCYQGASCRDPQGEVEVATAYLEGTLRWRKYEPLELQLTTDPDTGCRDFFCGTCRCSCECVCVTITESNGTTSSGELCNISYECDAPVWAGSVGYYDLSIALGRDQYGECIITMSVNGEEQEPVTAPGCASMTATLSLYGGTTIQVTCKQCLCEPAEENEDVCIPCPPGTVYPWAVSVTFVELGVSAESGNQFDEDQDGETIFNYPVEGEYEGYTIQANFGECDAAVAISLGGETICTFSGSTGNGVSMEAVDCPGDTLTLIYTITCENGSTLTVVISG